ncbi:MAG: ADP-ribosylglycohydrolase family protein [Sporichthyaceae bacterium]
MRLTTAQRDRACGVLLATAAGDALGAGYEFGPPLPAGTPVLMQGGGGFGWAPGEWTDDTSMAVAIARVAADGLDLREPRAQDRIAAAWVAWGRDAKDVGIQTRAVLGSIDGAATGARLAAAAAAVHARTGRSGGNGSLMRTAPLALAYLDDEAGLVEAATAVSALTHYDPEAGEACMLWCLAIRHAVLTGVLDVRVGLDRLAEDRGAAWAERIDVAEKSEPADFRNNGWVVEAFQAAWSAIHRTPVPADDVQVGVFAAQHLQHALAAAVRGGRDTDTVAAIAGGLLGAAWGASAVPAAWRRVLHGWPGLRGQDLVVLADRIATGEAEFTGTYPHGWGTDTIVAHPADPGLWIGAVKGLHRLPPEVDVVVSLCRVAPGWVPDGVEHVHVRLMDSADPDQNPHLGFVLQDTVAVLRELRAEGKTVFLHCVAAQNRTPTIAALYGAAITDVTPRQALEPLFEILPDAQRRGTFVPLLEEWSQ